MGLQPGGEKRDVGLRPWVLLLARIRKDLLGLPVTKVLENRFRERSADQKAGRRDEGHFKDEAQSSFTKQV